MGADEDGVDGWVVLGLRLDGYERSGEDAAEIAVIRKERLRWWGVEREREKGREGKRQSSHVCRPVFQGELSVVLMQPPRQHHQNQRHFSH